MHRALFQGKWRELFGNMILIAEVKPESKLSGWRSPHSIDLLMETACRCGDWISIHTNPLWGGSFEWLSLARAYVNEFYQNVPVTARPPILAKGFHETLEEQQQALQLADYALVVREDSPQGPANILNRVLYEPHSLDGLAGAPQGMRCVWNARDIVGALEAYSSGRKSDHHTAKRANFDKARKLRRGWLCQASNIKTPKDVHPKANAVLIGTNLIEFTSEILPQ
jgi:hypothetical protein